MTPPSSVLAVLDKPGKYLFKGAHHRVVLRGGRPPASPPTDTGLLGARRSAQLRRLEVSRFSSVVPLSSGEIV